MRIQHNIAALNSYRNLTNNNNAVAKNLEKLSSGYRINRAGDDAAGLAISEKMRAQITGLETAQKNASDGVSLVQTAEGALTEVHSMLNRMVELATQSANGTYDNEVDRVQLQKELDQLRTEINRIADSSNFNGIKLFDGSLSTANLSTEGINTNIVDMAAGVEITQGKNGGGSKGEYTIDLTNPFGDGDTIDFQFGGKLAAVDVGNGTADGKLTLTYGTDFTGESIEKQAEAIATTLSSNPKISINFNITNDGTSIKLVSKAEGNKSDEVATLTGVNVTDKVAAQDTTWKETAAAKDATAGKITVAKLLDNNATAGSMDIDKGNVIEFKAQTASGGTISTKLTAGEDFVIGKTTSETLDNIVKALNEKATLEQDDKTVIDETKIKFGDLFKAANDGAGGLTFETKASFVKTAANSFTIENLTTGTKGAASTETTAIGTNGVAAEYTMVLGAAGAQNLSIGDKLTFKGALADGRTFEFEVEVGKDFKVDDAAFTSTLANLETLLETKGMDIKLSDGTTVKSTEIFGTGKELDFDGAAGTITSTKAGTVASSKITDVTLTPGEASSLDENLRNGDQQTAATSVINFSAGVEYGSVIKVNGQNYEIVKNEDDITAKGNKAVVVKDLTDMNSVAKAMAQTLKDNLGDDTYKISASGSKVTISTNEIGSTAKAATISSSGDKLTQLEFTLDPEKFQNNSSVTINGQKYEFVEKGGKTNDANATAIEVDNFAKATSASLGSLLAEKANGVKNAQVLTDADGKVTVRGLAGTDGKIETPTVNFADGKGGLILQIGDTADDFNKMRVSIYNMHTADMGIGDIRIDTQDAAADAVDKIKSAINYVSDVRGTLGATQNRLDHTINNLSVQTENITAAESRIRDVDMAEEMMAYTKNNILVQAAQAMLAQANQVPQGVLQLLQ